MLWQASVDSLESEFTSRFVDGLCQIFEFLSVFVLLKRSNPFEFLSAAEDRNSLSGGVV